MNEAEYLKAREAEEGQPIVSQWYRHKKTGEYARQLNIMEINNYEEVE